MTKADIIRHLQRSLTENAEGVRAEIAATRETFASDTKSSAGDKHEVGRAMIQQELDKLEERYAKLIASQQELARVPQDAPSDRVSFGSLVQSDAGTWFLAIGVGRIAVGDGSCFVISPASPIGKALIGKKVGDTVPFNGRTITVSSIT